MVTLPNASQYGDGIWGLVILALIVGSLQQIWRYRATQDKRHLRASIGMALVVAAVTAMALGIHVLVCFGLIIPGAALMLASRPRLRLSHDKQPKLEPNTPCPRCGYDLRGTIAAGIDVCPECGERVK